MDNPIPPERRNPPDRVSELPDHLLLKILSLVPIKEAIATSILSKRWRYLWTFLDRLRFTCLHTYDSRTLDRFASFVHKVLLNSSSTKINKLFIQVAYYPQYNNSFSRFVSWAVQKNVQKLLLDFRPRYMHANLPFYVPQPFFELGQDLCICSSLRTLFISRCKFLEGGIISFKSLTRLTMTDIVLDDGVMAKLLSACPLLETLELMFFNGFSNLCITNPNLKRLMLVRYWFPQGDFRNDNVLKITAPYLQVLEISDCECDLQFRLVDVSSLVRAYIDFVLVFSDGFDNDYFDISLKVAKDLIQSVTHVKELALGKWLLQVFSMLARQPFSHSLSNCKRLTLNSYMSSIEFPAVITLLNNSPQLETLLINVDTFEDFLTRCGREPMYYESNKKFLNSQDEIIRCLALLHLKNVKIVSHQRCCVKEDVLRQWDNCNSKHELHLNKFESEYLLPEEELLENVEVDPKRKLLMKLVSNKELFRWLIFEQDMCCKISEFLLMNAKFLEKFVIISEREVCATCSTCCGFEYLSLVAEKLSTIPKSSTGAVIKFVEKQR